MELRLVLHAASPLPSLPLYKINGTSTTPEGRIQHRQSCHYRVGKVAGPLAVWTPPVYANKVTVPISKQSQETPRH